MKLLKFDATADTSTYRVRIDLIPALLLMLSVCGSIWPFKQTFHVSLVYIQFGFVSTDEIKPVGLRTFKDPGSINLYLLPLISLSQTCSSVLRQYILIHVN